MINERTLALCTLGGALIQLALAQDTLSFVLSLTRLGALFVLWASVSDSPVRLRMPRHGTGAVLGAGLVLALFVGQARAEGFTIGVIVAALKTAWDIIITLFQVAMFALAAAKYAACWTIAFALAVWMLINLLDAYTLFGSFSLTRWIERHLLQAAGCEPIDPEYGEFRPELFNEGVRPTPLPTSVARKRDAMPATSPTPAPAKDAPATVPLAAVDWKRPAGLLFGLCLLTVGVLEVAGIFIAPEESLVARKEV